jgi:hypothetical protein
MTKLLVSSANSQEIINLDEKNPNLICDDLSNHSALGSSATGQLFEGKIPIICGEYKDRCNCQSYQYGSWNFTPYPKECRLGAASAILTNSKGAETLLIAGGSNGENLLDSIETFDGTSWDNQHIAPLPKPFIRHCIVKVNSSTLLSIGGFDGKGLANHTYFYNSLSNKWTPGPSLNIPMKSPSCGILSWNNPESNQLERIVVAHQERKVSLLFLNDQRQWIPGPELPTQFFRTRMIEYNNSVILVGQRYESSNESHNLYKLSSPKGTWVKMRQTLKDGWSSHVAFLVPDELVNCYL